MPAQLFALATAFFFALHNMLTKKGLRYSNAATAVLSGLIINMVFLWGVTILFLPLEPLTSPAILIFVAVGFFQPGLTRLMTYKGIEALGIAITDPVRATTPLFSALMAILFLGEQMTPAIAVATLLIIGGITLLSLRDASVKQFQPIYLLYPLAASLLAGCSQVLRKVGMGAVPHPILAAAVTASSSFVVLVLILWIVEKKREAFKLNKHCLPWYLGAGVAVSIAMTSIYYALDLGKVTVVIPVASTGPFFSLVLSALFLRDVERVTLKIVLGAALIVGGVILLTLWK